MKGDEYVPDLGVSLDVVGWTALSPVRSGSLHRQAPSVFCLVPEVWSSAFNQGLVIRLDA